MTQSSVTIQVTPTSMPSTPAWMGEVAAFAQVLTHAGILKAIAEYVRFARARFDQYDLIDFVAVLIGYTLSGEPTLLTFYERLAPFAEPFMAFFGRKSFAPSLNPIPLSRCSRPADSGSFAHSFPEGPAFPQTISFFWGLV
jgi:hypothetical protein